MNKLNRFLKLSAVSFAILLMSGCGNTDKEQIVTDKDVSDLTELVSTVQDEERNNTEAVLKETTGMTTETESETLDMQENINVVYVQNTMDVEKEATETFDKLEVTKAVKALKNNNPLMTQRLGADPYVIVYDDTVYVYMTADVVETDNDGNVKENSYSKIKSLCVISSVDLVNWTDHGTIYPAGSVGASKWGNNSWAPAVCYKEIDGKTKFFIYFANGGNGIGVIESDSPVGPFVDPIGKALISRQTPNCASVSWLFDPAVFVDDDQRAYLYFGGGVPEGKEAAPGTGRVVELGDDMISIKGEPVAIDIPYLFEDSGINKIGDTYYYSYCSNWNVSQEAEQELGFASAQIVYMTSKDPMGPFTLGGAVLKNPGNYFGCYGNNHHVIFELDGKYYIAYHSQILEKELGISGGYRCTHIDEITVNEDGTIPMNSATKTGVNPRMNFDPYKIVRAATMATMGGINTTQYGEVSEKYGSGDMIVTDIDDGDWIAVKNVDFGVEGTEEFNISIRSNASKGYIKLCLDSVNGEAIGYIRVNSSDKDEFEWYSTTLTSTVKGVHDLVFVFSGEGYELEKWRFNSK